MLISAEFNGFIEREDERFSRTDLQSYPPIDTDRLQNTG
jgi:hypothetical protein